jgi:hypothetical protein
MVARLLNALLDWYVAPLIVGGALLVRQLEPCEEEIAEFWAYCDGLPSGVIPTV